MDKKIKLVISHSGACRFLAIMATGMESNIGDTPGLTDIARMHGSEWHPLTDAEIDVVWRQLIRLDASAAIELEHEYTELLWMFTTTKSRSSMTHDIQVDLGVDVFFNDDVVRMSDKRGIPFGFRASRTQAYLCFTHPSRMQVLPGGIEWLHANKFNDDRDFDWELELTTALGKKWHQMSSDGLNMRYVQWLERNDRLTLFNK